MAATSISTWVPILKDTLVHGKEVRDSAIYQAARRRPTRVAQTDVPRLAEADIDGGSTLTDDTNGADVVSMYDYQYTGKRVLEESEFEDAPQDTVDAAMAAWLHRFNKSYDNAAIGITAARSATASDYRPYDSIYYTLTQNDNSGAVSYSANANIVQSGSGGITYEDLSEGLAKVENDEYWDPSTGCVIMHPGLMQDLREMKDDAGRFIFIESTSGFPGGTATNPDMPSYRLFNLPVLFSHGARTSGAFTTIAGSRLIVFVNKMYLVRGDRIAPQSRFIPASINTSALQHTVQSRARQGFVLTVPNSASVVEDTSA